MNEHETEPDQAHHEWVFLKAFCNEIQAHMADEAESAEIRAEGDLGPLRDFGPLTQAIDVRIGRRNHVLVVTAGVLDQRGRDDIFIKFIHVLQRPLGDLLRKGHAILTWDADTGELHAEPYDPRAAR
jgi:hypothetical protein